MNTKPILLLFAACLGMAACNQQDKKVVQTPAAVPHNATLEEPFKYHKMIEVAPGNYYDVLSWGRGASGGGAYMILRSDSADQEYNTINGDLEGPIQDVVNSDLDVDGNPEIIIQAKSIDTNRYTNVFAYEYRGDNAQKLEFPRLTPLQRKGYRGSDSFYTKDGKLMREFPIYEGSGVEAKPSGQKRLLEYSLHSNSFSVKQVSKDSTAKNTESVSNSSADKHSSSDKPSQVTPKDGVVNSTPKVSHRERHVERRSTRHKVVEKKRKKHKEPEPRKKKRHRRG